jgi:intracellular multiplication protein IcmL
VADNPVAQSERQEKPKRKAKGREPIAIVGLRNAFYLDSYRKVLFIFLFSLSVNVLMGMMLYFIISNPPSPKYFASTISGRITPLYPLDQPNQSDASVSQWTNSAAIAAYSYNFVTYRQELQAASQFFTPRGWRDFMKALKRSNNLDAVKVKKFIVTAVATRSPTILSKGIIGSNYYYWRVQIPLLVTYQSANEFIQERNIVTMLIRRISSLNSPNGIGIEQFVVTQER